MKTLKSKLFFMTTLMMVITVFAGCPHKPINPPEPPEEDSTETIKQQLEFKVVWKNTTGVDLEISIESNSVDGATINAIDTLLKDGEETEFATVNKLVEIDSAHTLEMYKQEMLSSVVNSLNKISLRYFENGTMYSFSGNGELFKNINDYSEINDSLIQLNITKEILSREEFAITEGEEKSVEIKWQNKFTRPISLHIKSSSNPELNINKQIAPDEIVKIVDLSYFTYPNENDLNKKMLNDAMASYKALLEEVTFLLPTIKDSSELRTGVWTGDSIIVDGFVSDFIDIFNLSNYEFDNAYTLILYNRLLYAELTSYCSSPKKYIYSVNWKNDTNITMNVDLNYRDDKIYIYYEGDQKSFTLQPGETYPLPDLVVYIDADAYYFESQYDIFMRLYLTEMERVVVTYGDEEIIISGNDILDYLEIRSMQ